MVIITLLLNLILSFVASVILMCITYYLHIKNENYELDIDEVGKIYSKKVGPILWVILFAMLHTL